MASVLFIGELSDLKPLVKESVKAGHRTNVLFRKLDFIELPNLPNFIKFGFSGAHFVYGKLEDHQSLVNAIRDVDVVVSLKSAVADVHGILTAIRGTENRKEFIIVKPANANGVSRGVESENRAPYAPHDAPVLRAHYHFPPHPYGYNQAALHPNPNSNGYGYYQGVPQAHPHAYYQVPQNYGPYPQISIIDVLLRAVPLIGLAIDIYQYVGV